MTKNPDILGVVGHFSSEDDPSRQGIEAALSRSALLVRGARSQFSLIGASGEINFLPSGDRNQKPQLVKVKSGGNSGFGYDFVPINQAN